ncbi:hypothetical protein FGG08_000761 [Glutinoglossum americanum]|uniref:Guanine nucleotide-binding protein alpha-2 subunit n=1 Tax=Glutinoglossum americanum TaxID=1670608 RepID=A0A9P8I8A4_9PEZI|nr:hypothetical protein FGG08_000761 [Glutinoglossum americanum]
MCLGVGGSGDDDLDASRNREIDRMIRADEKKMSREIKLLLLGAGESGKSTILKQMRLLYASGFSKNEREDYRCIIFSNILNAFKILVEAMEQLEIPLENRENEKYLPLIALDRDLDHGERFPIEYLKPLKSMWADAGLKRAVEKGNEFALHDNLTYFFQDIDRLFEKYYTPTDQDILRSRLKTTGITETIFELGVLTYRMFDVGGQRSERKKWIHCFENVNCLMFLVAISGYDQCLVEDKDGNQMQEALMLFESIANSQWFSRSSLILFLNKIDLFREKLLLSPIPNYFPDYIGDHTDPKLASKFFQTKFKGLNRNPAKARTTPNVAVSAFFSLYRPISVTSSVPTVGTNSSFDTIFDSRSKPSVKPSQVISTLSSAVDSLGAAQQQGEAYEDNAEHDLRSAIPAASVSNNGSADVVRHLDGVPNDSPLHFPGDMLSGRFRPFNPPPPPTPMVTSKTAPTEETSSEQKSYSTVLTILESTLPNGSKTYNVTTSPIVATDSEHASEAVPHPVRFLGRMLERQERWEEYRSGRDVDGMWAISVKRQRKLKMKKFKYKKLMRKTRNLRRRLDRN